MKKTKVVAVLLFVIWVFVSVMWTVELARGQDDFTYMVHPVEDARVYSGAPTGNYGHFITGEVWEQNDVFHNPSKWSYYYLKYYIPENVLGPKFKIENVRLSASVWTYLNTPRVIVYATSNNWDEDTITWTGRPALGQQVGVLISDWYETFENYGKVWLEMDNYTFTAGYNSFALVPDNDTPAGAGKDFRVELLTKEAGEFGTVEFTITRVYDVDPQLVGIFMLLTFVMVGFVFYLKLKEVDDAESLAGMLAFSVALFFFLVVVFFLGKSFL